MMLSNHEISIDLNLEVKHEGSVVPENEGISLKNLSSQQKKIQAQFQEHYFTLLVSEKPVESRLQELLALSKEIEKLLTLLVVQKKEKELLLCHIKRVANVCEIFQKNEQLLQGRAYFLKLIEDNKEDFDVLLRHCSPQHNELLQEYINKQSNPDLFIKMTQIVSTVGWAPIVVYRLLVPTARQKKINQWLPETIDAQAKQLIIDCATRALVILRKQLHYTNTKQEQLYQRVSFNNPILRQLLYMESPQGLALLQKINRVPQNYDELMPYVSRQSPKVFPILLQTQTLLLQPFLRLIGENDEEIKIIELLIALMRRTEHLLGSFALLKKKQHKVLESKQSLDIMANIFKEYTNNQYLATITQEQIKKLSQKLEELEEKINVLARHIAQNDEQLYSYLVQISYDELGELKNTYCLPKTLEHSLLSLITLPSSEQQFIASEQAVSDFIYKYYYLDLINDETKGRDELITFLEHNSMALDKNLNYLLDIRTVYDECAFKVQKNKDVLSILEHTQSNGVLINLIKERLIYCERQFVQAAIKRDRIINDLALGDVLFKQLLTQEPLECFSQMLLEHQEIKACVTHYKVLTDKINVRLEMMQATRTVQQYIKERDTWWVALTDFFAQFCSLFKMDVSQKIDKAKILKKELEQAIIQCETDIQKDIEVVKKNKIIGCGLLDDLALHHTYLHEEQKEPFNIDKTFDLLSQALFFSPEKQRAPYVPMIKNIKRILNE